MIRLCPKCSKEVPKSIIIDGKERNLQKRLYCLECSPFNKHNTAQLLFHQDRKKEVNEKFCPICKQILNKKCFYFNSKRQLVSGYCKKCHNKIVWKRQKEKKAKAVEYKGGKCYICGYSKYSGALDFHHIDPKTKSLGIVKLINNTWSLIQKEIDKCVLLCANCHREVEGGITSLNFNS
jgi:hypothetical protein